MSHLVYLALGSNLLEPLQQIRKATAAIAALPGVTFLKTSPSYRNPPMDDAVQPDYVNRVIAIDTTHTPDDLLSALQTIETAQGRPREHAYRVARTIDIDILLYDNLMMETSTLTIPHPGLTARVFVVLPLLAIAPDLCLPNGERLASYAGQFAADSLSEIVDEEEKNGCDKSLFLKNENEG